MILPHEASDGLESAPAKFRPGELYVTPAALAALGGEDLVTCLTRHLAGDWGDLDPEDKQRNDEALRIGDRLLSAFHSAKGTKFWIITEWDRSVTTILLPSDY